MFFIINKNIVCAPIVVLLLILSMTGCPNKIDRPSGKWLVIGIENNPTSLDPRFATDAASSRLNGIIYSSLVKLDDSGLPIGDLAQSFDMPDDLTYRFQMKRDVLFHNGAPLDCGDVKYTYDLIRAPESKSAFKSDFNMIDSIVCVDAYNIEIKLKQPFAPFIIDMTVGIIPRNIDPETITDHPVGSGPFVFEKMERGKQITLRRFENYFGKKAWLDGVTFRILPNNITRVLELERGGIDLLQNSIDPEFIKYLSGKIETEIQRRPGINYNYLGFNLDHPILKNKPVREAIARAINRDDIIKYLWRGAACEAASLLAPANWAFDPNLPSYPYSPDKARKILDEAGYPDPDGAGPATRFDLTFKTSTDKLRRRIAETIKMNLAGIGIGMKIYGYEWGTFYRDIKSGNFELYTLVWVGITEPDIYWAALNSKNIPPDGTGMNRNRFRNAEFDRLTEEARSTSNVALRKNLYSEIQRIAAAELPYVSLYYTDDIAAYRQYVKGWRVRPGGDYLCLPEVRIER